MLLLIAMLAIVSELVLVPDITVAEQAALPMLAVLKGWLMAFTWTVVELVVTAMGLLPTATVMAWLLTPLSVTVGCCCCCDGCSCCCGCSDEFPLLTKASEFSLAGWLETSCAVFNPSSPGWLASGAAVTMVAASLLA